MTDSRTRAWLERARDARLLPASAQAEPALLHWPLWVLSGFGAWLTMPLLVAGIALALREHMHNGPAAYGVALLLLLPAVLGLRRPSLSPVLEQFLTPILAAGVAFIGYALLRDLDERGSFALVAVLAVVAWWLPQSTLRFLAGTAATVAAIMGLLNELPRDWQEGSGLWLVLLPLLGLTVGALHYQERALTQRLRPARAAWLEAFGSGALLVIIVALCLWSGRTFLIGMDYGTASRGVSGWSADGAGVAAMGGLLAAAAVGWLWLAWSELRRPALGLVWAVLLWLAWAAPALGPLLLVLVWCLRSDRPRFAVAALLAILWVIGSLYYQLSWPLLTKANVLLLAGVVLGGVAWWLRQDLAGASGDGRVSSGAMPITRLASAWGGLATLMLTLLVINYSIWHKEQLIRHGQPVYVALQPVDPRSLMQGDYMRLNFLPLEMRREDGRQQRRDYLSLQLDARGIAHLPAAAPAGATRPIRLPIKYTANGWVLVTDAWYFREGEAERWAAARYGEFRVDGQGGAVLVGLVDEQLRPL